MRTPSLPSTIRLVDHTAWPHEWLERLENNPNLGSTVAVTHSKDKFGGKSRPSWDVFVLIKECLSLGAALRWRFQAVFYHPCSFYFLAPSLGDPANLYWQLLRPTTPLKEIREVEKADEKIARLFSRHCSSWGIRPC
ncbi:hypothetical protein BKA70DRAFT_1574124 [Coprinopsis sp. MPI-PUGE-AT-0042]|nr:hypothetical protein BKA70DRAFT_1574124 [Coprinopsis sp. MPI-PUGE-AT-0042]